MVKKIIILGELNKKHFLPLFLVIYQITYKIFTKYYPEKITNSVINRYSNALAIMSLIFLPYIFKLKDTEIQKEKILHKRKWLHFLLLSIIFFAYNIMKLLVISLKYESVKKKEGTTQVINPFSEGPFAYIGMEMILLTVASIILLKYKYFIHHIISMVGFILFGNFSDLILNYYPQITQYGFLINIIQFISIVIDVIYYYYQKYMMEKLFYPYWKIIFTIGLSFFLFATATLIYVLVEKENSYSIIVNGKYFYLYFKNENIGIKIGKQLLTFIFSFIGGALNILNIYYFSPNYILISFQFSKIVDVLMTEEDVKKYYCIIFFIFQLFFLMIYLEILELNFCNLNKNTKKNIEFRSITESLGQDGRDSTIDSGIVDVNKDYFINNNESEDKNEKNIELLSQGDNEDIQ